MGRDKIELESGLELSTSTDRTPQQHLIDAIVRRYGGYAALARKIKADGIVLHKHSFTNWVARGSVPIMQVLAMAEYLNVEPYCLNYEGYSKLIRNEKKWEKVVKDCKILSTATIKHLLELSKEYEEEEPD